LKRNNKTKNNSWCWKRKILDQKGMKEKFDTPRNQGLGIKAKKEGRYLLKMDEAHLYLVLVCLM